MIGNVMICDDAAFMRMIIKDILEKHHLSVVAEAENGIQAVEMYQKYKPDIVMMDINMPEMDGIQALKRIMNIDDEAKVIMCSALGQQGMVIESIKAGALDFIVKPFEENRVIEAIENVLDED